MKVMHGDLATVTGSEGLSLWDHHNNKLMTVTKNSLQRYTQ